MSTNTTNTDKHLILGGARSGKSAYAEALSLKNAERQDAQAIYIATATAGDAEMSTRIARHQLDRSPRWQLIEEPINIDRALSNIEQPSVILLDCLTLWLNNCLLDAPETWPTKKQDFLESFENCQNSVVLVSNEVGHGVIPMGEISRRFVDEIGWLHQDLAKLCDKVTMVIAGLPQQLK